MIYRPGGEVALARGVALLALLGGLSALSLAPNNFVFATLGGLVFFFLIVPRAGSAGHAALLSWSFAAGYFCVALRWITEPFQVEAEIYGWMAPFALVLMASGLALFWGFAGWAAFRFSTAGRGRVALLVLTVCLAELARAYVLTGFPWAGLAQIWVDTVVAQSLAWIGPQGLAAVTLLLCALPEMFRSKSVLGAAPVVLGIVAAVVPVAPRALEEEADRPVIRIVQPNAPQAEKWDPEKAPVFFWRQIEATEAGPVRPDLVVWPETAIPQLLNTAEETLAVVAEAAQGVPVVIGMQRAEQFQYYNSLILLDEAGQVAQTYDKHQLVPFGEYMPFPGLFRRLGIRALAERAETGYALGAGPQQLDLGRAGVAVPLICYEAIFPQYARVRGAPRPDFLLQITNDAWFGEYAGPQQHLAQARMRAIEQGLPLVRSANTGISALIGSKGQIIAQMPLDTHGFIDVVLPPAGPATLYSRTGDLPLIILFALFTAFSVFRARRRVKD